MRWHKANTNFLTFGRLLCWCWVILLLFQPFCFGFSLDVQRSAENRWPLSRFQEVLPGTESETLVMTKKKRIWTPALNKVCLGGLSRSQVNTKLFPQLRSPRMLDRFDSLSSQSWGGCCAAGGWKQLFHSQAPQLRLSLLLVCTTCFARLNKMCSDVPFLKQLHGSLLISSRSEDGQFHRFSQGKV